MSLGKFLRPLVLAVAVAAGVLFAGPSEAKAHPPGYYGGYARPYYGGYGGYARPYYGGYSSGFYSGGYYSRPYYGGYYQPRGFSLSVAPGFGMSLGYSSGGFVQPFSGGFGPYWGW